jgi:hypothetical protein
MFARRQGSGVAKTNTWTQEHTAYLQNISEDERESMGDNFDESFRDTIKVIESTYKINALRDMKRMMEEPAIMETYREQLLDPIVDKIKAMAATYTEDQERVHMESIATGLSSAWDENMKWLQESYNTSNYLPIATLDFPALVKQYIRFLGKDLIPVQQMNTQNIEQRIFIKYLVDNNTGMEYETPWIYFQKDEETGEPLWKRLWNAGKGIRINNRDPITTQMIRDALNNPHLSEMRPIGAHPGFDMFSHLLDDNGQAYNMRQDGKVTIRTRLSYDFNIQYVQVTIDGETKCVRLPNGGIRIDLQTGGMFLNGKINASMKLPVCLPHGDAVRGNLKAFVTTGETVSFNDTLNGNVDFTKGVVSFSTITGIITGIYVNGHISNETNLRTIGFREYPEILKWQISDGCRFQLPFTVEDFAAAGSMFNFNLYNRMVQELVTNQEMFEDEYILNFLEEEFIKYDGYDSDIWGLESYVHTEEVDIAPLVSNNGTSDGDAGGSVWLVNPLEWRTDVLHNAIEAVIYELCDRGKMDNLGFVMFANPKCTRLLRKFTTWTIQKSTQIGGVQMNHAFGILTNTDIPIRVVSSNRVDAFTEIDAYQEGHLQGQKSREYFFKIVAYPMDKFHISYKHFRFARHLTNSPENAQYQDAHNPGGAAMVVTTSAQYRCISVQGIQGRIVCRNSAMIGPDAGAGLIPLRGNASNPGGTDPDPGTGVDPGTGDGTGDGTGGTPPIDP